MDLLRRSLLKNSLNHRFVALALNKQNSTVAAAAACPHLADLNTPSEQIFNKPPDKFKHAKPYAEVPGPKPLPVLGNTWRVFPIIGQYSISEVAKISFLLHQHFGEIVKLGGLIGRPDMLFVFNADEIEKCYRNEDPIPFRPSMPSLMRYKNKLRRDFFGDVGGLISVHGEPWRKFRSRVQNPFLQLKTVRQYVKPLEIVTDDFLNRCERHLDGNSELPADFENDIHKFSLECIGLILLDARLGCLEDKLGKHSEPQKIIDAAKFALRTVGTLELKAPYWRFLPTPLWKKYVQNMDFFRDVCMKYISEAHRRLKAGEPGALDGEPSLLERVLVQEKDEKLATVMALDLLLVSVDTISMALGSILYQVATRQAEQEKIYQELKQSIPDPDMPMTMGLLDKNQYTKGFIKEVLRMYSTIIGNGRTLQEDSVICGYHIPKGVQVIFPNLVTGNMEKYVENAIMFKPERWIKSQSAGMRLHPFASLPFGYGARMCMGRRFADLEIQILLVKLLRKYKLEFQHPELNYEIVGAMYAPKGDLKFKMTRREE